ncbi:hypothetical protein AB0M11_11580 [Streptomyces sp. NPDC051987]|uniref:hypothetical protein n=1 Tax=Streptomyces sp. NPDC051987 TaxID=3155808 RepID=UPI00342791CE
MLRARTCAMLLNQIHGLKKIVADDGKEVRRLQAELARLRAEPHPDPAKIAQVEAELAAAQQKLSDDQDALTDVQSDYDEHCGGGTAAGGTTEG